MTVFLAVAEAQGFAAAARRLGMSAPTVTRSVAALERRLGALLLVRTTRSLRLTEAGERYAADCRRILDEVEQADDAAAGVMAAPRGALSITAPAFFGELHVMPVVLGYLRAHRDVSVRTLLVDRVVNLLDEGVDVAVRIGALPDSSLTAVP
ncbi:MAG TPA: LysR family transcriptional regulator, partial [Achromobacter sp.]|nr:LysR family transcriptional regulator [Achromobacter sp.]